MFFYGCVILCSLLYQKKTNKVYITYVFLYCPLLLTLFAAREQSMHIILWELTLPLQRDIREILQYVFFKKRNRKRKNCQHARPTHIIANIHTKVYSSAINLAVYCYDFSYVSSGVAMGGLGGQCPLIKNLCPPSGPPFEIFSPSKISKSMYILY